MTRSEPMSENGMLVRGGVACEAGQAWWWTEGSRPVEEGCVWPLGIVAAHVAVLGP